MGINSYSQVTQGVKIVVEALFQAEYSDPALHKFVYTYHVSIENNSPYTIQLLKRHWKIFDSNGETREVEGDGVIGVQPIIEPGETHRYQSWSQLKTDMGQMHGSYLMQRISDNFNFPAEIPHFQLVTPDRLN